MLSHEAATENMLTRAFETSSTACGEEVDGTGGAQPELQDAKLALK